MTAVVNDFKNGVSWTGEGASATVGPFTLLGGKYGFGVYDTGAPNASLEVQTPAGNWIVIGVLATNSYVEVDLVYGTYQIVFGSGITLCDGFLTPIPHRHLV